MGGLIKLLYDTDFYGWTQVQAKLLRERRWRLVDLEHLIEEIESLGRQERRELVNRLAVLLGHLLKWQYQPQHQSNSWLATIREQRRKVVKLIQQNPSLAPSLPEIFREAYEDGVDLAARDTELDYETFPVSCVYSLEQILNPEFLPSEV